MSILSVTLFCASACLLLLALHPFVTYPISLRLIARLRSQPVIARTPPSSVALCVCAYNEEAVIAAKIENMLQLREQSPTLELLVYVDAASDGTGKIVRKFGHAIECVVAEQRHGKTYGMNTLLARTSAEIVVFSDANVLFDQQAVLKILQPFGDENVGAVCGHLLYSGPSSSATAQAGSAYWRLEERIKALESASGSVMGADGSIFAIRRSLHEAPPPDLIDDMFVSLSILAKGYRVVRAEDAIAFENSVSQSSEEFRRKIRIACQAFNVHRALWPRLSKLAMLNLYKYVSHKLLRWLVIYFLGASLLTLLAGLGVSGQPVLAIGATVATLIGFALLLWAPTKQLKQLRDILAAFLATGIGVWRSFKGERFQTWNPPASARGYASSAGTKVENA